MFGAQSTGDAYDAKFCFQDERKPMCSRASRVDNRVTSIKQAVKTTSPSSTHSTRRESKRHLLASRDAMAALSFFPSRTHSYHEDPQLH